MFGKFSQTLIIILSLLLQINAQEGFSFFLQTKNNSIPFGLTEKKPDFVPTIGLALSGGGARGFAQVGVLKAFKENNINVDVIAGTSMGSIIGGLYSAGYSINQIDSIVRVTDWDSFFSNEYASRRELYIEQKITEDRALVTLRLDGLKPVFPNSLLTGEKVSNFINALTINAPLNIYSDFSDFIVDYNAICTNLLTGEPVVFSQGSLAEALKASSSVTLLLPPVKKNGMLLVDGGLVANIPTELLLEKKSDIRIAINTTSPLKELSQLNDPWSYADQILSVPMAKLNQQQLLLADIIIEPLKGIQDSGNFSRAEHYIQLGYLAALDKIESINAEVEKRIINLDPNYLPFEKYFADDNDSITAKLIKKLNDTEFVNEQLVFYNLSKLIDINDYDKIGVEINYSDDNSGRVKVLLTPNKIVNNVKLIGAGSLPGNIFDQCRKNLVNKPYNQYRLMESVLCALRKYRETGYSLAQITEIEFNPSGNLYIYFDEGVINEIVVKGNEKTNITVIEREFNFQENRLFMFEDVVEGLNNLSSTNLFESIELKLNRTLGRNTVEIVVAEKPSNVLRFGLRVDNEYLTQAALDIRDENVFGTGTDFGVLLSGGIRSGVFSVEHRANRIFNTYLTYKLRSFFEFKDINTYNYSQDENPNKIVRNKEGEYRQIIYGASLGFGTQVEKFGNIIFEGKYHVNKVFGRTNYTGDSYNLNLFSFKFGFSIDSKNKYPYPDNGVGVNGYYETAQTLFDTDISYSKLFIDYESYFPINSSHNLSPKIQFGFADETLPLSQHFDLGGQYSFYGYRENEFLGRQVFKSSLEYRYKLPFRLFFESYLKVRYDIGSIWKSKEQIRFKDLRHGIGGSLSLDTPIGPAEFAVGRSFQFRVSGSEYLLATGNTNFYFRIGFYY